MLPEIAQSEDSLNQQLDELAQRVARSVEPLNSEIERTLQRHLSSKTMPQPVNKPRPNDQDHRAVELATRALTVVASCERILRTNTTKLDSTLLQAWPGIWRWLKFLDEQCGQQVKYTDAVRSRALITMPTTLATLARSKVLLRKVTSTAGVVTMMTRYWMGEGRYPASVERMFTAAGVPRAFTRALDALLSGEDQTPNCLPDLIAASRGAKAAATNAIEHLTAVLAHTPPNFKTLANHISLINNMSSVKAPTLLLALLSQGMIPLVVKMLLWLEKQSTSTPEDNDVACRCMLLCFQTLMDAMMTINGTSWVTQALDAGILPAILQSAHRMKHASEGAASLYSTLLSDMLCQYLLYKSVLRSAMKAIRRVERLNLDNSVGGPIWDAWGIFLATARERAALKEKLDKEETSPQHCHRAHVCTFFGHSYPMPIDYV